MSLRNPIPPTLINPVMLDAALDEINVKLSAYFPWLDNVYGKAQRMKREKNDNETIFPGIYVGEKDYLSMFPDSHIGNFTFFDISTPDTIINDSRNNKEFETTFNLIVWYDFRSVYPVDWKQRTNENVKQQFVEFFRISSFPISRIRMERFFDRPEEIYQGYSDLEIDTQFLMRPFGGFRIEGTIKYYEFPNSCP